MDQAERPRERLLRAGATALSDKDLVSLLIGWGTRGRPVSRVAEEVLALLDRHRGIPSLRELRLIPGLGVAKGAILAAAFELSRRIICPSHKRIAFPADVVPLVRHYADRKQEHFLALSLNGAHEVMEVRVVSIGTVNRAVVHPREVFADALTDRAAALIVAHNHPSGNVEPSAEDREVTARLKSAGDMLGVRLLDHVIFGTRGYYSFLEQDTL
jgi:DNA repair protein RadC